MTAFNVADGPVVTGAHPWHWAVEVNKFFLICDNLATHKTRAINEELANARSHMHFT